MNIKLKKLVNLTEGFLVIINNVLQIIKISLVIKNWDKHLVKVKK